MTFYVAYNASTSEAVIKQKEMLVDGRNQSKSTMFSLYSFYYNKNVLVHSFCNFIAVELILQCQFACNLNN